MTASVPPGMCRALWQTRSTSPQLVCTWADVPAVAVVAVFALAIRGSAAPAESGRTCNHFHLIERTDIIGRAPPPPDGPPPTDLCIPHGYLLPPGSFLPPSYFKPWLGLEDTVEGLNIIAKWPAMKSVWDKPLPSKKRVRSRHARQFAQHMVRLGDVVQEYRFSVQPRQTVTQRQQTSRVAVRVAASRS